MRSIKKAPAGNHRGRRRANPVGGCPLTAALAAIGGKWKLIAQQLRELIGDGLVQRQPTGALLAPVEYSLTDYGRSILPLAEDVRLTAHEAT